MALGGGSPAGREIQHQLPSCQEEPSAPTPTFPLQEGSGSARRGRRGKPSRAGKEAGFLSPLAVFSEVWLEDVCVCAQDKLTLVSFSKCQDPEPGSCFSQVGGKGRCSNG